MCLSVIFDVCVNVCICSLCCLCVCLSFVDLFVCVNGFGLRVVVMFVCVC